MDTLMLNLFKSSRLAQAVTGLCLLTSSLFAFNPIFDYSSASASIDYLYWSVLQDNLDQAIVDASPDPTILVNSETQFLKPKYKSGVRAALAYEFPCSDWAFAAVYTYYSPKWHRTFSAQEGGKLLPSQFPNFIGASRGASGTAEVKLEYQLLDLLATTTYCWDNSFFFNPYLGGRFLWFKEKETSVYSGFDYVNPAVASWRTDLPAGGVTLGVRGQYLVCGGISFIGHWGASLLGGRVKHHQDWQIPESLLPGDLPIGSFNLHEHHDTIVGGWEASVGIGYDWCFCGCPFNLSVGYEIQDWWNMPQRARVVNGGVLPTEEPIDYGSLGELLTDSGCRFTVHGLFVRAGFTF